MPRWLKIDLHIHSALSPCALSEMTPNNIVNMAAVLGLDVIAVTDHLAVDNVLPVYHLAQQKGILCIPGIEIQTREEVHLLCYFLTCEALLRFAELVLTFLNHDLRLPKHMDRQFVFNQKDEIVGEYEMFLHQSIPLSIEEIWRLAENYGACCIPAHIDRPAFGLLGQLGFVPSALPVQAVEATVAQAQELELSGSYRSVITASDAHSLEQMVTSGHSRLHPSLSSVKNIWQWLRDPEPCLVRSFAVET